MVISFALYQWRHAVNKLTSPDFCVSHWNRCTWEEDVEEQPHTTNYRRSTALTHYFPNKRNKSEAWAAREKCCRAKDEKSSFIAKGMKKREPLLLSLLLSIYILLPLPTHLTLHRPLLCYPFQWYIMHTKYPNTFFHSPFVGLSIKQKPQNCIYATHLMINNQIFQFAMKSEILFYAHYSHNK